MAAPASAPAPDTAPDDADRAAQTEGELVLVQPPFGNMSWMSQGFMQQISQDVCQLAHTSPEWSMPPQRVRLVYARCKFYNSPGGCQDPFCRFLHDEEMPPAPVFFDGTEQHLERDIRLPPMYMPPMYMPPMHDQSMYEQPQLSHGPMPEQMVEEVTDARIYFKNCPAFEAEQRIREITEPFGEVTLVHVMDSKLHNGRVSGFIHMTSREAAENAVEKLNNTALGRRGAKLFAKLNSCKTVMKPVDLGRIGYLPTLVEEEEEGEEEASPSPVSVMATPHGSPSSGFGLDDKPAWLQGALGALEAGRGGGAAVRSGREGGSTGGGRRGACRRDGSGAGGGVC